MSATFGVTDRLDVSAAVPFVRVSFSGERLDVYRGSPYLQASAVAAASGLGDVALRAKYNAWRQGASGLAVAGEVRLPTGDKENLLGTGSTVITPHVLGSYEPGSLGVHGSFGVGFGGPSTTVDYGGAVTMSATTRLTLVGEFLGRRLNQGGRLIDVTEPHPNLIDVQTLRLSATNQSTTRSLISVGFRWNVAGRGLISGNVLRPISTAGLNARWLASIAFDYSLGG
jgi:Putative MetA-pathway of phenol degradation